MVMSNHSCLLWLQLWRWTNWYVWLDPWETTSQDPVSYGLSPMEKLHLRRIKVINYKNEFKLYALYLETHLQKTKRWSLIEPTNSDISISNVSRENFYSTSVFVTNSANTHPLLSTGPYIHLPPSSFLTITEQRASYLVISVGAKHTGISNVDFGPTLIPFICLRRRQKAVCEVVYPFTIFSNWALLSINSQRKRKCYKISKWQHNIVLTNYLVTKNNTCNTKASLL